MTLKVAQGHWKILGVLTSYHLSGKQDNFSTFTLRGSGGSGNRPLNRGLACHPHWQHSGAKNGEIVTRWPKAPNLVHA